MRLGSYIESQQSKKIATVIVKRGRPFGLLLYVAGLVLLCFLPNEDFSRRMFFDENALMAGLVRREFTDRSSISQFAKEIQNAEDKPDGILPWLENRLAEMGLEVYHQNFTAEKPVSFSIENPILSGTNVYGILRAGRALGTESIILSAPHQSHGNDNIYGIATMMALANYFKTKNYWAKDIIFLVTSHDEVGMQAWLDSYMGLHSLNTAASSLPGRSGAIQAVINVELPSPSLQYANIIAEGVNGILPNLDLVNVMVYLCKLEGIPTAFHLQWETLLGLTPNDRHLHSLQTVLALAAHQAHGLPLTNHALFLRHRIDSLTVRGVGRPVATQDILSLYKLARALEGVFRSVNNLLERLHHAEFFYYTASQMHFISIGLYMPPFGLLLAPVILEALSQWMLARMPHLLSSGPPSSSATSVGVPFPFQAVMGLILVSFASGLLLYVIPSVAALIQHPLQTSGLVASLTGACAISVLAPLLFRTTFTQQEWRMAKAFGLILLLLVLIAVAMMNFSLAVFLTLALPTPAVLAQPCGISGKVSQYSRLGLTLLFSPPLCLFYFCLAYSFLLSSPHDSLLDLASTSLALLLQGAVAAYNSWFLVGSWLYVVLCMLVWPMWLLPWILSSQRVQPDSLEEPHLHSD